MSYMTISSQENHHFSLCSYFHAHPTTLLLKILEGPMHGPSPHLKFGGAVPPVPPRSPPLVFETVRARAFWIVSRRLTDMEAGIIELGLLKEAAIFNEGH